MVTIINMALWVLMGLAMVAGILSILGGSTFGMIFSLVVLFSCGYAAKKLQILGEK